MLRGVQRGGDVCRPRDLDPGGDRRRLRDQQLLRAGDGEDELRLGGGDAAGDHEVDCARLDGEPQCRPGSTTVPVTEPGTAVSRTMPSVKPAAASVCGRLLEAPTYQLRDEPKNLAVRTHVAGGVELDERELAGVARRDGTELRLELGRPELPVGLAVDEESHVAELTARVSTRDPAEREAVIGDDAREVAVERSAPRCRASARRT